MKERAQVNDSDELIDTDELKSSSEGVYIRDRILRCNKARHVQDLEELSLLKITTQLRQARG